MDTDIKEKAIALRKDGLTYKEIVIEMDGLVSLDWCKRNLKSKSVLNGERFDYKNVVSLLVAKAASEEGCTNKEAVKIIESVLGCKPPKDRLRYLKDLARKQGAEFIKSIKATRVEAYQPSEYYVYAVEIDGVFIYIGKGYKTRWEHTVSGVSHVYELNRLHFDEQPLIVICLAQNLTSRQAHWFEQNCITKYNPEFNIRGSGEIFNTEDYQISEEYKLIYELCKVL